MMASVEWVLHTLMSFLRAENEYGNGILMAHQMKTAVLFAVLFPRIWYGNGAAREHFQRNCIKARAHDESIIFLLTNYKENWKGKY